MGIAPNYYESHLFVAAVRVLTHVDGRPPTPKDVAKLLEFTTEKTFVLARELSQHKVIRMVESPFDVRLDILDPVPLEALPREQTDAAMTEELADFKVKSRERKDEMSRMFREGEAEKRRRERVSKLEEQFKSFKPKPGQLDALFKSEDPDDEDGEKDASDDD